MKTILQKLTDKVITSDDFINATPQERKIILQVLGERFSFQRIKARHRIESDSTLSFALNNSRKNKKTIRLLKNIARSVENYARKGQTT